MQFMHTFSFHMYFHIVLLFLKDIWHKHFYDVSANVNIASLYLENESSIIT